MTYSMCVCACVCSVILPPMVSSSRVEELKRERIHAGGVTDHSTDRITLQQCVSEVLNPDGGLFTGTLVSEINQNLWGAC